VENLQERLSSLQIDFKENPVGDAIVKQGQKIKNIFYKYTSCNNSMLKCDDD
jgi:hypothetical protein